MVKAKAVLFIFLLLYKPNFWSYFLYLSHVAVSTIFCIVLQFYYISSNWTPSHSLTQSPNFERKLFYLLHCVSNLPILHFVAAFGLHWFLSMLLLLAEKLLSINPIFAVFGQVTFVFFFTSFAAICQVITSFLPLLAN